MREFIVSQQLTAATLEPSLVPRPHQNSLADRSQRRMERPPDRKGRQSAQDAAGEDDSSSDNKSAALSAVEARFRCARRTDQSRSETWQGEIEIRFHTLDELERLIDLIATLEGQ